MGCFLWIPGVPRALLSHSLTCPPGYGDLSNNSLSDGDLLSFQSKGQSDRAAEPSLEARAPDSAFSGSEHLPPKELATSNTYPNPPHPEASPGHTSASYLALTVSLKLSQLQGDLGILAAYRNESTVSPVGVAHVGREQVLGRRVEGDTHRKETQAAWEGVDGLCPKLFPRGHHPLWSRQSPRIGPFDSGSGPRSRQ